MATAMPRRGACSAEVDHCDFTWPRKAVAMAPCVQPTNNDAERALRHAVIWRKLSFGTQSAAGSRFVETMLTVIETCRQQNQNAFAYVTQAVTARIAGQKTSPLLARV